MAGRKSRALAIRRRLNRPPPWMLLALALAAASIGAAHSQTLTAPVPHDTQGGPGGTTAPAPPTGPELQAAPTGGVIHPPALVDPGMVTAAPNPAAFPTPIVKPPVTSNGTTQTVPK